eukprot:3301911-Amphidinium_carterae.1
MQQPLNDMMARETSKAALTVIVSELANEVSIVIPLFTCRKYSLISISFKLPLNLQEALLQETQSNMLRESFERLVRVKHTQPDLKGCVDSENHSTTPQIAKSHL